MRNGKFAKKGAMSKTLVLVLSLILVIGCVTGGTLAWLLDTSDPVTNTFTDSDIGVHLNETKPVDKTAKMVPGWTIEKDPKAWVDATSEDCYLFVKVEEKGGVVTYTKADQTQVTTKWSDFLSYAIADGWEALNETTYPGVYYRVCDADAKKGESVKYTILGEGKATFNEVAYTWADNEVLTNPTVTKEMMDAVGETPAQRPTLTFTAYASQLWKSNKPADMADEDAVAAAQFTAEQAWKNLNPTA